jgi:hypothetical protein
LRESFAQSHSKSSLNEKTEREAPVEQIPFSDLQPGHVFSFWYDGGSVSKTVLLKISAGSCLSITADVHPLNADPEKDVLNVTNEQRSCLVYVRRRMSPNEYKRVTHMYPSAEKLQPTAA